MTDAAHGTRTQVAADELRRLIIAGDLAPGQRISERAVGEYLGGTSRTPLREALKVLAAEGLVTLSPNRGATVTALSEREVEEAIEFLIGLESQAADAACEHITEAQLAEIEHLHDEMHRAFRAQQLMAYFELNQTIHQRIVEAAGNRVLARVYATECARIRRYRYAGNRRHERWERAMAEHDRILEALKARDGALLREMLRAHHRNGWRVARQLVTRELVSTTETER